MRSKKLKVRVEDMESGEVTELFSNCIAVVTADDTEDHDNQEAKILTAGKCRKAEMLALAQALRKAEGKMKERILKSLKVSLEELFENLNSEADA